MDIKVIKDFKVGSSYFFGGLDGFTSKDEDWLLITDNPMSPRLITVVTLDDKDCFIVHKDVSAAQLLEYQMEADAISAGKFLVPEVCAYYKLALDDIKGLEPKFRAMDKAHKYEEYIYDCYCTNNKMELTPAQREEAYRLYKENKNDKHKPKRLLLRRKQSISS